MDLSPIVYDPGSTGLVSSWLEAFHKGDAEALSATFAKDGVYIPWTGPFRVEGRDAIRAEFEGFFRAYPIRKLLVRDASDCLYAAAAIYNYNWTLIYGDGKGSIKTVYGRTSSANIAVEKERTGKGVIMERSFILMATSLLPTGGP